VHYTDARAQKPYDRAHLRLSMDISAQAHSSNLAALKPSFLLKIPSFHCKTYEGVTFSPEL
jgi:hypothetical protein